MKQDGETMAGLLRSVDVPDNITVVDSENKSTSGVCISRHRWCGTRSVAPASSTGRTNSPGHCASHERRPTGPSETEREGILEGTESISTRGREIRDVRGRFPGARL